MEYLRQQLSKLVTKIQQSIATHKPEPFYEQYYTYNWEKFDYSATGIDLGQGRGGQLTKPNWLKAIHQISQHLLNDPLFIQTLQMLPQFSFDPSDPEYTLKQFVSRAIETQLTTARQEVNKSINQLIESYIRQLKHQTVQVHASILLSGITLQSDNIQLTPEISLRRTTPKDIAVPKPILDFSPITDNPIPTAVLDINTTLQEDGFAKFHQDISHSIDILKLFGFGAIRMKANMATSDSLLPRIYRQTQLGSLHPAVTVPPFYLDIAKEEKLKAFFPFMQQHMPDLSGINRQINNLSVSFDRYIDACIESRIFERTVMYAVMGLEALYLNENLELSYKLRMRCSKALSFCGLDPLEVQETISAGYNIRSTFAHGDHVSTKDLKKYNEKFGNSQNITNRLCNFLRISLCATIILDLKKDSLIKSLDNAMLSDTHTQELRDQFSPLNQYIG